MGLKSKLIQIQRELNAPKSNYNSFGKYSYRSCEDILEAVKPLLAANACTLVVSDTMDAVGDRIYVKATATIYDCESEESVAATAYAREAAERKGMDDSQVTGSASSYARKYALNGLFCIDDNKDPDTAPPPAPKPANAEKNHANANKNSANAASGYITSEQAKALYERCQVEGVDAVKLCAIHRVQDLRGLTQAMYDNILNKWDTVVRERCGI